MRIINERTLVILAMFFAITCCLVSAMALGTPVAVDGINQVIAYLGIDWEMPLPSQFK